MFWQMRIVEGFKTTGTCCRFTETNKGLPYLCEFKADSQGFCTPNNVGIGYVKLIVLMTTRLWIDNSKRNPPPPSTFSDSAFSFKKKQNGFIYGITYHGKQSMRRYPLYNQHTTTSGLARAALIPTTTPAKRPTVNS